MPATYFVTWTDQTPVWLHTLAIDGDNNGGRYWMPAVITGSADPVAFVKRKSSRFAVASLENKLVAMMAADSIEPLFHLGHPSHRQAGSPLSIRRPRHSLITLSGDSKCHRRRSPNLHVPERPRHHRAIRPMPTNRLVQVAHGTLPFRQGGPK
jgi:hypothetical protein